MTAENPPAIDPPVSPDPPFPAGSVVHPPSDPPVSEAPLPLGVGERGSGDTGTQIEERQPLRSAGAHNTGKDLPMPTATLLTELDRAVDDAIVGLLYTCQDELPNCPVRVRDATQRAFTAIRDLYGVA